MNEALAAITDAVGDVLRWASFPRSDAEVVEAVEAVSTQLSRLDAARAMLAAQLDASGWAKAQGASSTALWLRDRCHVTIGAAHRAVNLGKQLNAHDRLLAATAEGSVTADQAAVIGRTLADLPHDVGPDVEARAEEMLIGFAPTLTPAELHKAGERILDLVAPEIAEQAEAKRLARLEAEAHRKRSLVIRVDDTGCSRIAGRLDAEATATVRLAIDALARPMADSSCPGPGAQPDVARRVGANAADGPTDDPHVGESSEQTHESLDDGLRRTRDSRTAGQRNADALFELCRMALDEPRLPEHGGTRPQIIVTTSYDALAKELGAGTLDTGVRLSPETVRRMACDAQIIPAVLGSAGEILDLGRSRRLINAPLRNALIARDGGCTFPGCDRPPRWCQAHHAVPWSRGGRTSLGDSTLLCTFHHRLVHVGDWKIHKRNDGRFAYIPPPHIDPQQRPRVNGFRYRP